MQGRCAYFPAEADG